MEGDAQISRSLSELDNPFLLFRPVVDGGNHSSASSSASLLHLNSKSSIATEKLNQRSLSADHLALEALILHSNLIPRRAPLAPNSSSSSHSSLSSVDENNDGDDENDDVHDFPDGMQYTRFDESPASEASHECLMHASIPRRREFCEQFRDLAQLHRHADVPHAKWDDASRLFPKQFGLLPSVAINIWKQVDSDADMMLTESEYCLAAHLANCYSTTGFSLLASQHQEKSPPFLSKSSQANPTSPHQQRRQGQGRTHKVRQQRSDCGLDIDYSDSDEDDSHYLLLSPDPRALDQEEDGSLRTPKTHDGSTEDEVDDDEEEQEEDYHKSTSDDEIGVRALLPSSTRRTRSLANTTGLLCDKSFSASSSFTSSSSSHSASSSSSSQYTASSVSQPSSSAPMLAARLESVCSVSPSAKPLDPVEVLAKVTPRSIDDIRSLPARRRRRLLTSLVRAAKSTNYTLLRLNNELVGELQELCDQHTNLNAQVRHLSELSS